MSGSVLSFLATILITLAITVWAARRGQSKAALYTAGGEISGTQNGLAISGDFLSATTLLGTTALFYAKGADTALYYICPLVGFALMLLLIAGPLRRLGRYTIGDVMVTQLGDERMRLFSGVSSIVIALIYLIAQMVGAGQLIKLLFGLDYMVAVILVGVIMMTYVLFGGMTATTWVQIIKACLLLGGASFMAFMVMWQFGFSPEAMFAKAVEIKTGIAAKAGKSPEEAAKIGFSIMAPGNFVKDPISTISFGMALMFGTAGLPHPRIPLPTALYGAHRSNSRGLDLSNENTLTELAATLQATASHAWTAAPLLAVLRRHFLPARALAAAPRLRGHPRPAAEGPIEGAVLGKAEGEADVIHRARRVAQQVDGHVTAQVVLDDLKG